MCSNNTKQNNLPIIKEVQGEKPCLTVSSVRMSVLHTSVGAFPVTEVFELLVIFSPWSLFPSLSALIVYLSWICFSFAIEVMIIQTVMQCCLGMFCIWLPIIFAPWIIIFKNSKKFILYIVNTYQGVILEYGSWMGCMIMWL